MATVVLVIVGSGIILSLSAARFRLGRAADDLRAVRLGEDLVEEIVARPYFGTGQSRTTWCIDDFDGYHDGPDQVTDGLGDTLASNGFARSVDIAPGAIGTSMHADPIPGKVITVQVTTPTGLTCEIIRFAAEPSGP